MLYALKGVGQIPETIRDAYPAASATELVPRSDCDRKRNEGTDRSPARIADFTLNSSECGAPRFCAGELGKI